MRLYTQDQLREVAARAWELQREHLGVPHPPPGAPPDSAMAVPTAPTAPTGGQPLSDGSILIDDDDAWGGWSSEGQEPPEGPADPQGPPAATLMPPPPKWPARPQHLAEPKRMPIASGTLAIADQVRVTVEVPRGHGGSLQGSPCQSPRSRSGHGGEGWLHEGAQSQYEERLRQDDRGDPAWRDWNRNRRAPQGPQGPAAPPAAPRDPPVPPYDRCWGADRLAHLYNVPEPPRPYRVGADGIQADLGEFQWQLMSYARQKGRCLNRGSSTSRT